MKFLNKRRIVIIVFSLTFILLFALSLLSESFYEGADNVTHYVISRYSLMHPFLLLDHWGKPVFTLLSSPFSQFGFKGLLFFNIIVGLCCAYTTMLIAQNLNYQNSILVALFVSFAPYYFMLQLTGLTEILFSAILIVSIYLAIKHKHLAAAILISFIPLIRNEGVIFLPFFFLYFLFSKKYKAIFFLPTGVILYSIIGFFYYHDFLWLIHKNPYDIHGSVYGNGSLFHFINNYNVILGWPLSLLFVLGILSLFIGMYRKGKTYPNYFKEETILILLPFLSYLAFHSILWWKGIGGSMGLLRVMVGVIPLAALFSLKGFNVIDKKIAAYKPERITVFVLTILAVVIMPFKTFSFPVRPTETEKIVKRTAQWMEDNKVLNNKIYYYSPFFLLNFDFDPYEKTSNFWMIHVASLNENDVKENGILVWDSQIGTFEGGLPLENILRNKDFTLLNVLAPEHKFEINGKDYEICVFQRSKSKDSISNFDRYDSLWQKANIQCPLIKYQVYDFEHPSGLNKISEKAKSGKNAVLSDSKPLFEIKYSELRKEMVSLEIAASAYIYTEKGLNENPVSFTIEAVHDGKAYNNQTFNITDTDIAENKWSKVYCRNFLKDIQSPEDLIKIYFSHKGSHRVYIDDLAIKIFEIKY